MTGEDQEGRVNTDCSHHLTSENCPMSTEDTPQPAGLPDPDTHCWDDDTNNDVWSYSQGLMRATIDAAVAKERERIVATCRKAMPQPVANWSDAQIVEALRGVMDQFKP